MHQPSRADIVAEARSWCGTPFHWQASVKGRGCDCKGLVAGVARALGLPEGDALHAGISDYAEVDPILLRAGLAATLDKSDTAEPGDVLLLKIKGKAQHLAIYAGGNRMIHTYAKGPRGVIEVPMGNVWRDAIDSIWRWRSVIA